MCLSSDSRKLAATPTWEPVGPLEKQTIEKSGYAIGPEIVSAPDGTLYVAYISPFPQTNPNRDVSNLHVYQRAPKSETWTKLPDAGAKGNTLGVRLAVDAKGVLYMAYGHDGLENIYAYKFEGGKWTVLQKGIPSGNAIAGPFTMNVSPDGVAYICTVISIRGASTAPLTLFKYDAAAKKFQVVGKQGFTPGDANYGEIAFHKEQPYVAFIDYKNDYTVSVMTFVNNRWRTVGNSIGITKRKTTWYNIKVDQKTGAIYLGYGLSYDKKTGEKGVYFEVQKYEENAWTVLGEPQVAPYYAGYGAMAFDQATSTPWIIYPPYNDKAESDPAAVCKFADGKWIPQGSVGSKVYVTR